MPNDKPGAPKERPIIFSAPMVRALLDGRKTQTRRIIKPQPEQNDAGLWVWPPDWRTGIPKFGIGVQTDDAGLVQSLEYDPGRRLGYAPGDRLWVREAHALVPATAYRASVGVDTRINPSDPDQAVVYREGWERCQPGRWRPSIHMPRWASRLTLAVTDVRVQRLQEISERDAADEGLATVTKDGKLWKWGIPDRDGLPGTDNLGWPWIQWCEDPRQAYSTLWDSIHGAGAWDANPWVVAVTFTVEEASR